jgi:hypothetical protein
LYDDPNPRFPFATETESLRKRRSVDWGRDPWYTSAARNEEGVILGERQFVAAAARFLERGHDGDLVPCESTNTARSTSCSRPSLPANDSPMLASFSLQQAPQPLPRAGPGTGKFRGERVRSLPLPGVVPGTAWIYLPLQPARERRWLPGKVSLTLAPGPLGVRL